MLISTSYAPWGLSEAKIVATKLRVRCINFESVTVQMQSDAEYFVVLI